MREISKEACVETLSQALAAQGCGADQIELCGDLAVEGLTPDVDLVRQCLAQLSIPVKVMIRPRPGDFIYNREEITTMLRDIDTMGALGVDHIVLGCTTTSGTLDIDTIQELCNHAHDMKVTIHKAIDSCHHPIDEVRRLVALGGIHSILTSGGAATAIEGIDTLRKMKEAADGQLDIIAAGSITSSNLNWLDQQLELTTYHGKKIMKDWD